MNGEDTMSQTSVNVGARSVPDSNGAFSEYRVLSEYDVYSPNGHDYYPYPESSYYHGYLNYSFGALRPATEGAFRWSTESLPTLTSLGEVLSYVVSEDGLTLTAETADRIPVFRLVVEDVLAGRYKAFLYEALDHANPTSQSGFSFDGGNSLIIDVEYILTDSEGNTASSALRLQVNDSRPLARSDHVDAEKGALSVSRNVLENDIDRVDGLALYRAEVEGGDAVGQVSFTTEGEITFTPNSDFGGLATILYDAIDGDGDIAREVFTVFVPGDRPVTPDSDFGNSSLSPMVTMRESRIARGEVEKGLLGYDVGLDGAGRFTWHLPDLPGLTTESGSSVSWSISRAGRQLEGRDENGDRVILVQNGDLEQGAYTVALFQPLDHDSVGKEYLSRPWLLDLDIGYTITDSFATDGSEGDSASGVLHIDILDDPTVTSARAYRTDDDVTAEPSVATSDVSALVAPVASASASPDASVLASAVEVESDRQIESSSSFQGGYSFNASFDAGTSAGYFLNMGSGFDASSTISWEGRFGDKVVTFDLDAERVAEVGEGTLTSSGSVEVALSISDLLDDSDEGDVVFAMEATLDSHVPASSGQGADSTSSIDAQASSSVQAPGLAWASGFQWGSDNPLGQWLGESNLFHE
ncbi:Ig-like domain-containing protein [Halomonas litopenaei]|uniref:Ig-like domain-containing protein n=1 Tax=Halomonas litopenaei TaxID=2109328 RepID=UPI001A8C27D3|nr:Ig-like domain-containing protein [Halomonas litopenaei]MBN8410936.1 hypothetical protein [Halomonas litopenaei]